MAIYKTKLVEGLNNRKINDVSLEWMFFWIVSQNHNFPSVDGFLVAFRSPFPSFDLSFVNQLGGTVYRRHVRDSIYKKSLKGLTASYISSSWHHFKNSNKINIKGGIPKNHDNQNMVTKYG